MAIGGKTQNNFAQPNFAQPLDIIRGSDANLRKLEPRIPFFSRSGESVLGNRYTNLCTSRDAKMVAAPSRECQPSAPHALMGNVSRKPRHPASADSDKLRTLDVLVAFSHERDNTAHVALHNLSSAIEGVWRVPATIRVALAPGEQSIDHGAPRRAQLLTTPTSGGDFPTRTFRGNTSGDLSAGI